MQYQYHTGQGGQDREGQDVLESSRFANCPDDCTHIAFFRRPLTCSHWLYLGPLWSPVCLAIWDCLVEKSQKWTCQIRYTYVQLQLSASAWASELASSASEVYTKAKAISQTTE